MSEQETLNEYHQQSKPCRLPMFTNIVTWAEAKNLTIGANSFKQLAKLTEEAGELAAGVCRGNRAQIRDSIGDCVVVLTILAEQYGLTIEECIDFAWSEIKDRTGKTENGVFIKDEE